MNTRQRRTFLLLIVAGACLATCYLASQSSADTPSAGKTKKAVEAAEAATKNANDAAANAFGAEMAARDTRYPDTDDGKAAEAADKDAESADMAAFEADKEAAKARAKACKSGKAEDEKAADAAEKAAQDAETRANAADAVANKADRKADPFGKQLHKKSRDADRAWRAALRAAWAAICFARQCADLMDESSELSKKRKKETIETIDGLASSVQLAVAPPPLGPAEVKTAQGLHTVTFTTVPGRVIVNLPDDMRAGDTISGTVVADPKGQTEEERSRNMTELTGLVVEIATPKKSDGAQMFKFNATVAAIASPFTLTLPSSSTLGPTDTIVRRSNPAGLGITLINSSGSPSSGPAKVPIEIVSLSLTSVAPLKVPQLPTIGQQGRPIEIIGPFDGNITNTKLMYAPKGSSIQDFEKNTENVTGGFGLLQPLAESPRKCVLQAPVNVTGLIELFVKDGQTQTTSPYRNVSVNLTAPKTNLLKGESTELHVEVNGLQGIKQPIPLTLESHGVITMEGGMYQPLMIQPSQVGADGRYSTTRGVTGVQAGGWGATATVVTQPFNIVLRDPDPPQTILINSFTGDYIFCGSGPKLSGTGQIERNGCVTTLTDDRPDRQVLGKFDSCVPVDNGRFSLFHSWGATVNIQVSVTATQPPKKRVYFNPLGRPAPPIQDVSAFATCP